MIGITRIITYLRDNLPSWSIEGAAEQSLIEDSSRLKLPAMYVALGKTEYVRTSRSTYRQEYTMRFRITTCTPLEESHDRTGKYAQDFVAVAEQYLRMLLVNNKDFDPDSHAIMLVENDFVKIDKARYYHRFDFEIAGVYNPDDVTPLHLDYFDTFFATYKTTEFTDDTPVVESIDTGLFFTPPI